MNVIVPPFASELDSEHERWEVIVTSQLGNDGKLHIIENKKDKTISMEWCKGRTPFGNGVKLSLD